MLSRLLHTVPVETAIQLRFDMLRRVAILLFTDAIKNIVECVWVITTPDCQANGPSSEPHGHRINQAIDLAILGLELICPLCPTHTPTTPTGVTKQLLPLFFFLCDIY